MRLVRMAYSSPFLISWLANLGFLVVMRVGGEDNQSRSGVWLLNGNEKSEGRPYGRKADDVRRRRGILQFQGLSGTGGSINVAAATQIWG